MGQREILDNPSLRYTEKISEAASRYFKDMNLHFFAHFSVYPNGKYWLLCNNSSYPHAILNDEKILPIRFGAYDKIKDKVLFPHVDKINSFGWTDEIKTIYKNRFGILNPMMITRKYDGHIELFLFDLHSEKPYDKYINHFEVFEKFIYYHKDKCKKIIQKASKQCLTVKSKQLFLKRKLSEDLSDEVDITQFPQPKKYYLRYKGKDKSLSAKEYSCLSLLAHGYQFRSIAKRLGVSTRTVETYFDRIKKKFNLSNREEIVMTYWDGMICPIKSLTSHEIIKDQKHSSATETAVTEG